MLTISYFQCLQSAGNADVKYKALRFWAQVFPLCIHTVIYIIHIYDESFMYI